MLKRKEISTTGLFISRQANFNELYFTSYQSVTIKKSQNLSVSFWLELILSLGTKFLEFLLHK